MRKYILRRLLQSIPILFGVTVLSYVIILITPGGPVAALNFGPTTRPEDIQKLEAQLGVNDPFYVQYLRWLAGDDWMRWDSDGDGFADKSFLIPADADGNGEFDDPPGTSRGILRGDFGRSFVHKRPTVDVLTERLPATLELGISALVVGSILGILIGIFSAINHQGWFDQSSRIFSVIINAVPNFWFGLVLILVFGSRLKVLPIAGRCKTLLTDACPPVYDRLEYLILPTIVLAAGTVAVWSRFVRTSMLDVVNQDYIRTAHAKGLPSRSVWFKHGMRNAMIPVATFLGPSLTFLLNGAVITETIFAWPGVGRLAISSVTGRDYPVVMTVVLYTGIATILGFLISDILYALIDPRIRLD